MMVYDVAVIGGGVAGLAAATQAKTKGATVLLLDKEARPGGRLRGCIEEVVTEDGLLCGVEYAEKLLSKARVAGVKMLSNAFVRSVAKKKNYEISYISPEGLGLVKCKAVVLATGAREKSLEEECIFGDRPAGVFSASEAQYLLDVLGKLPTRKCVVVGSSDFGLQIAKRLTIEGAHVEGVYEPKPYAMASNREIALCLNDFNVPLYLSHQVTKIAGEGRVKGVSVAQMECGKPVESSVRFVECDAVILANGRIPQIGLSKEMHLTLNREKGVSVNQYMGATVEGAFAVGECHCFYSSLTALVSNAKKAGSAAVDYESNPKLSRAELIAGEGVTSVTPNWLDLNLGVSAVPCYFRSQRECENVTLRVKKGEEILASQPFARLYPAEMQSLTVDFGNVKDFDKIRFEVE